MKQLAQQIVEFYEKLSSWEHAVVKDSELTPGQIHAIEIIGHEKSLRMKELAQRLGVTTGTLTVMVDKLEQKKLLKRCPHESDRRSYLIELTDEGEKHFLSHHEYHLKLTEDITSVLTREETETLRNNSEQNHHTAIISALFASISMSSADNRSRVLCRHLGRTQVPAISEQKDTFIAAAGFDNSPGKHPGRHINACYGPCPSGCSTQSPSHSRHVGNIRPADSVA